MSQSRLLTASLLALIPLAATPACGTLFYPERQDATMSGRVDPNILILDGIGLLFFVIPGLVAFGIDFATGAIYLPEDVQRGEGPFLRDHKPDEIDADRVD